MRTMLALAALYAASKPAFAVAPLPEPEVLSLVVVGAVGLMLIRRRKK